MAFLHRDSICCRRLLKQIQKLQEMVVIPWDVLWVDEEEPRRLAEQLGITEVPLVFITRAGRLLGHSAGVISGGLDQWLDWAFTSMLEDAKKHA